METLSLDQFAFRPSGFTTAALILHTQLPSTNPYVVIIALDVSKAFDTVRHETLLRKLAQLNIPDCVYSSMIHVDFFGRHAYCTKFSEITSAFLAITAVVIQGLA